MKVKKSVEGEQTRIMFIPETEEEKKLMGSLRNHFFFGIPENGTFPEYDGINTEDNFVTQLRLKYKNFQSCAK